MYTCILTAGYRKNFREAAIQQYDDEVQNLLSNSVACHQVDDIETKPMNKSENDTLDVISYQHGGAMNIVRNNTITYDMKFGSFIIKPCKEEERIVK